MGSASRRKGVTGEREVATVFEAAGFAVRGLEGQGDHLCIPNRATWDEAAAAVRAYTHPPLHIEVKRRERLAIPTWLRQLRDETTAGTVGVLCFRQNRGEWYATLRLDDLVELLA